MALWPKRNGTPAIALGSFILDCFCCDCPRSEYTSRMISIWVLDRIKSYACLCISDIAIDMASYLGSMRRIICTNTDPDEQLLFFAKISGDILPSVQNLCIIVPEYIFFLFVRDSIMMHKSHSAQGYRKQVPVPKENVAYEDLAPNQVRSLSLSRIRPCVFNLSTTASQISHSLDKFMN